MLFSKLKKMLPNTKVSNFTVYSPMNNMIFKLFLLAISLFSNYTLSSNTSYIFVLPSSLLQTLSPFHLFPTLASLLPSANLPHCLSSILFSSLHLLLSSHRLRWHSMGFPSSLHASWLLFFLPVSRRTCLILTLGSSILAKEDAYNTAGQ